MVAKSSTLVLVVAVALLGADGRVLLHRRRIGANHGGLWEFPGGKVEPGESPDMAAIREIEEELGVRIASEVLEAVSFASDRRLPIEAREPHVILLYSCRRWSGEVRCLEGEEIAWFAPDQIEGLPMPPLDYPLARALRISLFALANPETSS